MIGLAVQTQVETVVSSLARRGVLDQSTVVLIGSAARGSRHASSDIDVLLTLPTRIVLRDLPYEVDLHVFSHSQFVDRLRRGDDFACWAVRYGEVISDKSGWWAQTAGTRGNREIWPDWKQKIRQARRRLNASLMIVGTGDLDAAWEECAYAAGHVARAVLFRAGIFPLSRLELPAQLTQSGFPHLGCAVDRLVLGTPNPREFLQLSSYLKKWMAHLSKAIAGL